MEKVLKDGRLFKLLERADQELAAEAQMGGCMYCGAKLHVGDYPRKPRGGPEWEKRYSFCCSQCRKRKTPPSVRFLGRKVYVGVMVTLAAAMMHGLAGRRVELLRRELGVDRRTLKRWREWWLKTFVRSPFWKAARARFMPLLREADMPLCLAEVFHADAPEGMVRLLRFLAPVTTSTSLAGRGM
jgi:hypothetical protein